VNSTIFATVNLSILAVVLSHFFITTVLSHSSFLQCSLIFLIAAMLSNFFDCYSVQPFLFITQSFLIATVLRHFLLLQCSTIPCATVLSHSSLLQCSVISRCYSAQSFSTAPVLSHSSRYSAQSLITVTMLSHFSLQKVFSHSPVLQCSVISRCYNAQPFLVAITRRDA
jgi:hypothetical protein